MKSFAKPASTHGALEDRVALVTGASGAIGGVTCRVLARNGATIVASARNVAALDAVAADVRAVLATQT